MSELRVSTHGIRLNASVTAEPVNVLFDDKWVWSFNPVRDATPGQHGSEVVCWPDILRPYLRGQSQVVLVGHTSRSVLFDDEVAFTDSADRVSVVDSRGYQLGVDKGGRLQRRFDDTDQAVRDHILETVDKILTDLRDEAGLDAFLAFGCLLGAVRSGKMIGHDADADVAYVSKHSHPFDIIGENRAAMRVMRRIGYRAVRMSAADFKIWVPLTDGRRCGVDVFGGYFFQGDFFLLPTVHGSLERSSLLPTSTVVLEGRELVAPAKPEDLLALTYGPAWRVPDPSFKFDHPRWLIRHMDGYWRGARDGLRHWETLYKSGGANQVPRGPSLFAQWTHTYVGEGQDIVEVGAGTGRDAVWLAQQGHRVLALDYSSSARKKTRKRAARSGVDVEVRALNLLDVRSSLVVGARLAHDPKPRHVYARMLVDELSPTGRTELFRFASMISRRGGFTFLEFRTGSGAQREVVIEEVIAQGGVIQTREQGRDLAPLDGKNPAMCRLVVRW